MAMSTSECSTSSKLISKRLTRSPLKFLSQRRTTLGLIKWPCLMISPYVRWCRARRTPYCGHKPQRINIKSALLARVVSTWQSTQLQPKVHSQTLRMPQRPPTGRILLPMTTYQPLSAQSTRTPTLHAQKSNASSNGWWTLGTPLRTSNYRLLMKSTLDLDVPCLASMCLTVVHAPICPS